MSRLWPVAEAAQADYETLRTAVLAGTPLLSAEAARFGLGGLWALIQRPAATPSFVAALVGADRPAWSPYVDPRVDALAACYQLLVAGPDAKERGPDRAGLICWGGRRA
ncbi:MAG TPA: hypothetical protein VF942_13195 [Acidimicrobiales bacterium]